MRSLSVTLLLTLLCAFGGTTEAAESPGPRHPIGPDVPLTDPEREQLGPQVTVEGRTATAIQSACDLAVRRRRKVVFLPAGEYVFEKTVNVPGGLVVLGEGGGTRCVCRQWRLTMFQVAGDDVRISRMCLEGPSTERDTKNTSTGIHVRGHEKVRIDHCELSGFCRATNFTGAGGQLDHSKVHDCPRDGLGYGICIVAGARVLVADNDFSQCRHALASNGALDWSSPKRLGKYVHKPDVRKTHWEFVHNRVGSNDRAQYELCAVDTHPGMDGTFVVEHNLFENLRHGVGIRDGSGLIRGNLFRRLRTVTNFRKVVAISISYGKHNGIVVEGTMPRDVEVTGNRFENVSERYRIGRAENIIIDGKLVERTEADRSERPKAPKRLKAVGVEYRN